jgi:hypothetical protein
MSWLISPVVKPPKMSLAVCYRQFVRRSLFAIGPTIGTDSIEVVLIVQIEYYNLKMYRTTSLNGARSSAQSPAWHCGSRDLCVGRRDRGGE